MKKMIRKIALCCLVLLLMAATREKVAFAGCWCRATSQESTQLQNKAELIKQLQAQLASVAAQVQMIEGFSSSMAGKLDGASTMIYTQFDKLLDVWKNAMGITHVMDDFDKKYEERHPGHDKDVPINNAEEKARREKEWQNSVDAYMKGLNMSAKELENARKARQDIYDILQSSNGQVQALKALGGMVNHTSMILERNSQIMAGQIQLATDRKRDEIDDEQNIKAKMDAANDNIINSEYDKSKAETFYDASKKK